MTLQYGDRVRLKQDLPILGVINIEIPRGVIGFVSDPDFARSGLAVVCYSRLEPAVYGCGLYVVTDPEMLEVML